MPPIARREHVIPFICFISMRDSSCGNCERHNSVPNLIQQQHITRIYIVNCRWISSILMQEIDPLVYGTLYHFLLLRKVPICANKIIHVSFLSLKDSSLSFTLRHNYEGSKSSYTLLSCFEKQQKMTSISSASFAFFAARNSLTSRTAIFAAASFG